MKKVFCLVLFCIFSLTVCAAEFDPAACSDLRAKIFYINPQQAVLYVSADTYTHSRLGFDEIEVRHKFFKKKYWTNLTLEMAKGEKSTLRLAIPLMTRSKFVGHLFKLSTRKPGILKKAYTISSLQVQKTEHGVLVFKSYTDSDHKNVLRILKIDMADNSAALSSHSDRKFQVAWYPNTIVLTGLPKGNDTFYANCYTRKDFYYSSDCGVTVLKYRIGSFLKIFPVYEKFYLTGLE